MSLFRKQRFTRQPQHPVRLDKASTVRLALNSAAPELKTNIGSKAATPWGISLFSAVDNAFQFPRDLALQNADVVTVQMLLFAPVAPSGSGQSKLFGTRGTTAGDGNRRGWEVGLDGGGTVETQLQVIDSAGSRSSSTGTTGYSGADVTAKPLWATFQIARTPGTSTDLTVWLKVGALAETTGTVTVAVPFADDTTLLNFPEICGQFAGSSTQSDYQVLACFARIGTITQSQRQAFYAAPWQPFVDQARLPLTDAPAAAGNVTGTFASTLSGLSLFASGNATNVGTFASTLDNFTMSASGNVGAAPSGTFASTLGGFVMAATGTINDTGAFASTLGGVSMAASGTVAPNVTGTFASTLDGISMLASGFVGTPPVFTGSINRRHLRPRQRPQP